MSLLVALGFFVLGRGANTNEIFPKCTPPTSLLKMGTSLTMTCTFVGNITETEIAVYRFPVNSSNPEKNVDCYFHEGGHRICEILKKGVNFTLIPGKKHSEGILKISDATEEHAGKYVCQTLSPLVKCDPCLLQFDNIQDSSQTADENSAANNNKNTNQKETDMDRTSTLSPGAIAGIVTGVLIPVAGAAVAGVVFRKWTTKHYISSKKDSATREDGMTCTAPTTRELAVPSSSSCQESTTPLVTV